MKKTILAAITAAALMISAAPTFAAMAGGRDNAPHATQSQNSGGGNSSHGQCGEQYDYNQPCP
jgi:hypothetical protein